MKIRKMNGSLPLVILLSLALAGCETGEDYTLPDPPGTLLSSEALTRDLNPGTENLEALVTGNTGFALDMMRTVAAAQGSSDNLVFSPYSISSAMVMVYGGTGSGSLTETEFREVFGFPEQGSCHEAFNALDLALTDTAGSGDLTLRRINSVWVQEEWPVQTTYLDLLMENYGAGINLVDFMGEPDRYREEINTWIEEVTESRIVDLLGDDSITTDTRLVLTNAVYFYADWESPFESTSSYLGSFTLLDGTTVQASFMNRLDSYRYAQEEGSWQAVEIPYVGGTVAALFVLPATGTLDSFVAGFDAQTLSGITDALAEATVDLYLPSFSCEWGGSIADTLMDMGLTTAFSGEADLSGIDGEMDLCIFDVAHKGFIAVGEEGTEASAATAASSGFYYSYDPYDFIFRATRPFLFLIRELETGTILFTGIVRKP